MPTLLKSQHTSFGKLEDTTFLKFQKDCYKRQRNQRKDLENKVGKNVVLKGPSVASFNQQKESRFLMTLPDKEPESKQSADIIMPKPLKS